MEGLSLTGTPNHLREERMRRNWRQRDVADQLGTTVVTVRRWESGRQLPSAYYRVKLCALFEKSMEELGLMPISFPTPERETPADVRIHSLATDGVALWTVPHARNRYFTGRDDLLKQLEHQFSLEEPDHLPDSTCCVALTQSQAIKGLGGIGKTQIAIEYAYRSRDQDRYRHILWINAANEETLMNSFATLAELLPAFPAKHEMDQWKLVAEIKRWLEQCQQRWLLIFDNVENIALVQTCCPQQGHGSLLFTTRAHAIGSLAASLEVEQMGLVEGTYFLLHRAQRQQVSDEESNEATNIVIALAGFPLALDQAGAYIEETGCTFRDYLQLYQAHRHTLLARRGVQTTSYPDSVATTWSLSFQKVAQANPGAAELLHLCAFLEPDMIPEELIREGSASLGIVLQTLATDPLLWNDAIRELRQFSLIQRDSETRVLRLHRLVQAVLKDNLGAEDQRFWAERVVRATSQAFPETVEMVTWPRCRRYLPQAQACSVLIQAYSFTFAEAVSLLLRTAYYVSTCALYEQAESLYQHVLRLQEQTLGPEHPQRGKVLARLARIYYLQGKYEQAEPLYRRAVRIQEQVLGPEHPNVAMALNGLAIIYHMQRKHEPAKSPYQRARWIYEQAFGPEHPNVAMALNNLANLCQEQGKYIEAESLYRQALYLKEQTLGPEHPDVAYSLYGLAHLYVQQGKYEAAELLYQRTLRIWEQAFESTHLDIANALHEAARLQEVLGNKQKAATSYQRALAIREHVLGLHHPKTVETRNLLLVLSHTLERDKDVF
ncbi:MAG TPA: FxSxx-COOH system tetratricopeptide repeat protein [Ktedonobacteraceae bacterium]|nr:FxSxx-COOH system tetratricopeptide repeat protein [Ktedonobacteraceae bacterium]